jgi:hypothetical protein
MAGTVLPVRHQAELPLDRLILNEAPDAEALEMDVVIVGAGPGGLATAIELARLVQKDNRASRTGDSSAASTASAYSTGCRTSPPPTTRFGCVRSAPVL